MYTEQELNEAIFKVVEQNKVPYTQDGIDFLLEETIKLLPKREVSFQIESIEELSVQDRLEGKLPKITMTYQ
jgi:hypothetical protein